MLAAGSGSFTHAADRLSVTQPSFTALIQNLEAVLGVKLFERTTRSIELTAAGAEFLVRIQRPIIGLEEAYRSILELASANRGSIVFGALPSTSLALVPAALASLRTVHPALYIRVLEAHNEELLVMVRTNQIEFALAAYLEPASDLSFMPLIDDCFCAVFPSHHTLAEKPELYWHDLPERDLILISQGSSIRSLFERATRAHDTAKSGSTQSHYDVTHLTTATALVRRGLGITVVPRLALPELDLTGLQSMVLNDMSARRKVGLIYRRDHSLSPAATAFTKHLQAIIQTFEKDLLPITDNADAT